jgi:hypothetical protein
VSATLKTRFEELLKNPDFLKDAEFVGGLADEDEEPTVETLKRVVVSFRRMADHFERVLMDHALENKKESTL